MPVLKPAGAVAPTMTWISLDGPLEPLPFVARTRTKYVPFATPRARSDVAALPVEKDVTLLRPDPEPASIVYVVAAQPDGAACQLRATALPVTAAVSPVGAPGAPTHTPSTVTTTSLDAPLVPAAFRARTRTK